MPRRLLALLPLLIFLSIGSVSAQMTALVGGTVVNPGEAPAIEDAVVLIDGDTIAEVGTQEYVQIPEDAEVIDTSGQFIMPGLVDGHVHFFQSGGLYTRPDVIDLREVRPYEEELALILERLEDTFARYLRSGITSVVDVGGPMWNLEVRARAQAMGRAPTVVTAGPLISPVQPEALTTDDPPILRIDEPEEARAEVRRQVEAGFDLVKIWYIVRPGETPDDYRPVVEATIDEAHALDTRVSVHATQLETARAAVKAGADILVHSVSDQRVDDDFIQKVVDNDVLYTPTLIVGERYQRVFAQQLDLLEPEKEWAQPDVVASLTELPDLGDAVPSSIRARMDSEEPVASDSTAMDNLRRLHEAGAAIVMGTDAGNIGTLHGPSVFREVELMKESGLSPLQILETATVGGARLMGQADRRGTIEPGMLADLVILNADPRADVAHWHEIDRVVKRGQVFAAEALME